MRRDQQPNPGTYAGIGARIPGLCAGVAARTAAPVLHSTPDVGACAGMAGRAPAAARRRSCRGLPVSIIGGRMVCLVAVPRCLCRPNCCDSGRGSLPRGAFRQPPQGGHLPEGARGWRTSGLPSSVPAAALPPAFAPRAGRMKRGSVEAFARLRGERHFLTPVPRAKDPDELNQYLHPKWDRRISRLLLAACHMGCGAAVQFSRFVFWWVRIGEGRGLWYTR